MRKELTDSSTDLRICLATGRQPQQDELHQARRIPARAIPRGPRIRQGRPQRHAAVWRRSTELHRTESGVRRDEVDFGQDSLQVRYRALAGSWKLDQRPKGLFALGQAFASLLSQISQPQIISCM